MTTKKIAMSFIEKREPKIETAWYGLEYPNEETPIHGGLTHILPRFFPR